MFKIFQGGKRVFFYGVDVIGFQFQGFEVYIFLQVIVVDRGDFVVGQVKIFYSCREV